MNQELETKQEQITTLTQDLQTRNNIIQQIQKQLTEQQKQLA